MGATDRLLARLGKAEVPDLSLGDQLPDRAGDILDRDVGVDAVLVIEVDRLDAQPLRAAGERLGVTGSAVSQSLRRLEERLGVALVQRTTRSVHLTEAGARLYAAARPALDELRAAVGALGEMRGEPGGNLRVPVAGAAGSFLSGPLLASFLEAYPRVHLDCSSAMSRWTSSPRDTTRGSGSAR